MKLFNTNNIEIIYRILSSVVSSSSVSVYQVSLWLIAPKFFSVKIRQCDNLLVKRLLCMYKILYFVTLPAIDVFLFSRKSVGVSHCICVWTALFHMLFLS